MAGGTKEVNFSFYLTPTNLHLNSHMWLVATVLKSTVLDIGPLAVLHTAVGFFLAVCYLSLWSLSFNRNLYF